ncbi:TetR family transcriptional regulator [Nocardioides albertanoniae]|uniref:TetR family transcriptional regulator n=1 Tax=Nocardioides albertanoniae TaxID=1175486 RepID=A0A543A489_9ACTN|nr:TetR/AcrR family transcriptional regulator [Nocardioides albertanoniae]TQL67400.1 TetR family transcriptional regulator [Nocardioides albertanoniae]
MSTRDKILDAAASIMGEDGGQRLTVRAVAARAGVGMGTLRHHFPTQRVLLDAVLASMYESAMPDDRIHDTALPARQRLVDNLGRLVAAIGTGDEARTRWDEIFRNYISPDAPDDVRTTYATFDVQATRRIETWLSILVEQGALEEGDNRARAHFLLSVVNGLALWRALPLTESTLTREIDALTFAAHALPFTR